jgi:hypothetical protein
MGDFPDCEHFIPLRRSDLVDLLCTQPDLSTDDVNQFRRFCRLLTATYHLEYNQRLEELKTDYAPFDPDSDTRALAHLSSDECQRRLNELFSDFAWLLERANFTHLSRDDIEPSLLGRGQLGIHLDVDFSVFERIAMFGRGEARMKRTIRRLRHRWKPEEIEVPIYRRLVLILKMRPHRRLGKAADTRSVYLKIFKEIPKLDIKMLLPGARVRFSYLDRGKIGLPFLSGILMALGRIASEVFEFVRTLFVSSDALFSFLGSPGVFWGLAAGTIGYGTRSYFSYQGTKHRHNLTLTQSLYYQNLDSNAGVLFRLLDEAEEQECREALLAYFFLWRQAGAAGWTSEELDHAIEQYLERTANVKIDFEIADALAKLEKHLIIEKCGERFRARPMAQALNSLGGTWDRYFSNSSPK